MRTSKIGAVISGERLSKLSVVMVTAIGFYAGNPSVVDFQDMASQISSEKGARWLAHKAEAPGQLVLASVSGPGSSLELDQQTTGSLFVKAELKTRPKTSKTKQRINRSLKGGRVVSETTQKPPVHFSAGSIVKSHNLFLDDRTDNTLELAFVKPMPQQQALQVAAAFHPKPKASENKIGKLPTMVASLVEESAGSVIAYAPETQLQRSPFASVLKEESLVAAVPKLGKHDHEWAAKPLPKMVFSKKQQQCLAEGIYFEARGESVRGQAAVSQVILNRVRNPSYPNSVCGVVYQNRQRRNSCQFSFACDRIRDKVRDFKSWKIAKHVAAETTSGRIWFKEVGSATHYHASYVKPKWARSMNKVGKIGLHLFYRTKNGGWS